MYIQIHSSLRLLGLSGVKGKFDLERSLCLSSVITRFFVFIDSWGNIGKNDYDETDNGTVNVIFSTVFPLLSRWVLGKIKVRKK